MKKLLALSILASFLACMPAIALPQQQQDEEDLTPAIVERVKPIEVIPVMNAESSSPNRIWVGTFQIVWNELMDSIIYGPVRFVGENPKLVKELNKQNFKKTDISENSYYTKYGEVSPELKEEIETGIKEKFNETSDILDSFDWSKQPEKLFIYTMLKKDFKFLQAFDKLPDNTFANGDTPIKYFGISDISSKKLYKNVRVLFYNSSDDFAVKLYTKDKDEVIVYRTNEDKTFDKYYSDIKKKTSKYSGNRKFVKNDELQIPEIRLYQETSFPELEGKDIKRTKYSIDKTIETVDFKMNNEGVKLKSEAAMMVRTTALMPEEDGRKFCFDDNFVLFMSEKGQKTPYYAMKVSDVEILNQTGRN